MVKTLAPCLFHCYSSLPDTRAELEALFMNTKMGIEVFEVYVVQFIGLDLH